MQNFWNFWISECSLEPGETGQGRRLVFILLSPVSHDEILLPHKTPQCLALIESLSLWKAIHIYTRWALSLLSKEKAWTSSEMDFSFLIPPFPYIRSYGIACLSLTISYGLRVLPPFILNGIASVIPIISSFSPGHIAGMNNDRHCPYDSTVSPYIPRPSSKHTRTV